MQLIPVRERSPEAKLSYIQGYRAGAESALAHIENGRSPAEVREWIEQEHATIVSTFSPTERTDNGDN